MSRIEGMKMTEEIKGRFIFEKDTKRYHRFKIVFDEDMSGTIYIPKEIEPMPERLILGYADEE